MVFCHRLEVRFRDCDAMGHVNHAVYFTYLEQARMAFWHEVFPGQGYLPMFILARAECDFKGQIRSGDAVEIQLRVTHVGRSSFTFGYNLVDARDQRPVASARTVLVTYDYQTAQTVPISPEVRTELERRLIPVGHR